MTLIFELTYRRSQCQRLQYQSESEDLVVTDDYLTLRTEYWFRGGDPTMKKIDGSGLIWNEYLLNSR